MKTFLIVLAEVSAAVFIAWMRIRAFREKKTKEPEQTAHARLKSRQIKSGTHGAGRSKGGYTFFLTFQLNDGSLLELAAYEDEYGALQEGQSGKLTWKGPYFVSFQANTLYSDLAQWAQEEHRTVDAQIEYLLTQCVNQRKGLTAEPDKPLELDFLKEE